eukprot:gnl/TRDRNA2_/TRDRNA2_176915_c6_seq1.p1 gnl/TRDRNA2_/TRDRNA2_176915_c6~~gnl/TRDRNA2_/TRDRNA2_176915_c6_seq1.p1  ORF type:complete len:529 (+),score=68.02 gnl/TRDRNA2_/TRDRNA2_176915_c6_seq1:106-1692(+)
MSFQDAQSHMSNNADDGTLTRHQLGGPLRSRRARTLEDLDHVTDAMHGSDETRSCIKTASVLCTSGANSSQDSLIHIGSARFEGDDDNTAEELGVIPHCRSLRVVIDDGPASETKIVMNKYLVDMTSQGIIGEGASSICRKGKVIGTGEDVAIKVYKDTDAKHKKVTLHKFERQVAVLKDLHTPFVRPDDNTLWHAQLERLDPGHMFMNLIDYSKDENGQPGPDTDGIFYIVTEVAQYSLKDFLAHKRAKGQPIQRETVKSFAHAVLLVVAGLHAKGLVHLDLKPENLMVFSGDRLKLIDVDGCLKIRSSVRLGDDSVSFSPSYCAPEWCRFLIGKGPSSNIIVTPGLDVWSIGMTICELVTMEPVNRGMIKRFLRLSRSSEAANGRYILWLAKGGFSFADWLKDSADGSPVSKENWDPDFVDLVARHLLVNDARERKNLAECLSHPYFVPVQDDIPDERTDMYLQTKHHDYVPDEHPSAHGMPTSVCAAQPPKVASPCWLLSGIRKQPLLVDRMAHTFSGSHLTVSV